MFHVLFPGLAAREMRALHSVGRHDLPDGSYGFFEAYCTDPECGCENVVLSVLDRAGRHFATIDYDIGGRDHRRLGVPRLFLDPLNEQTEFAPVLLRMFQEVVLDAEYEAVLERHHRLVKEKVGATRAPDRAERVPGRNDPCPCGSGRKVKRCCGSPAAQGIAARRP